MTLRQWLRRLTDVPQTSGAFASDVGLTHGEGDAILRRLADESLVRQLGPGDGSDVGYGHVDDPDGAMFWVTTVDGNALAKARLGRPMPRSRADELLAQLVQRVVEYNADGDRFFDVEWVEVFGSYQRGSDPVGDVDVRALAVRRFDWDEHERRRVEALDRPGVVIGRGLVEQLNWPYEHMRRFLRGRSPTLDLQLDQERVTDLPKGAETTLVYERMRGGRAKWPSGIRT